MTIEAVALLASQLRSRGEHLACAESCTGGLLSARIASLSGISGVYIVVLLGVVLAVANVFANAP